MGDWRLDITTDDCRMKDQDNVRKKWHQSSKQARQLWAARDKKVTAQGTGSI